jgi:hypothetical protein
MGPPDMRTRRNSQTLSQNGLKAESQDALILAVFYKGKDFVILQRIDLMRGFS